MDGGALVALEHPRDGALPAVGRGGRRDLRQDGVPDPLLGRNTLDGEDFGESLGTRYAHLVVLSVIQDEGPALDAGHEQRRARDAGAQGRGRDHRGPPVAQQRDETPQPAVEEQVRLWLGGELQVRDESRVPIGPHAVPVGEVVARLRPH